MRENSALTKTLIQAMKSGVKMDIDAINGIQKGFEIAIKGMNIAMTALSVESKNRRAMATLERMNIMDTSTAIDLMLGDPNEDKVKCPLQDDLITRADCLDYSGSHGDDCRGCEIGRATKAKLLP